MKIILNSNLQIWIVNDQNIKYMLMINLVPNFMEWV
jgi:hypothetical protein